MSDWRQYAVPDDDGAHPDTQHAGDGWRQYAQPDHEPATAPDPPSGLSAALRGATEGLGMGLGGAVAGLMSAQLGTRGMTPAQHADWGETVDRYRRARDAYRAESHGLEEAHPGLYGAARLGGALVTGAALPGGALSAAGQGAVAGLGSSDADLTSGEVGHAAADTIAGGAVGALAHGAGALLGRGVGAVARTAQQASRDASEASLRGALGAAYQHANRAVENLDRLAPDMSTGQAQQAGAMLTTLRALKARLIDRNLEAVPLAQQQIARAEQAYRSGVPVPVFAAAVLPAVAGAATGSAVATQGHGMAGAALGALAGATSQGRQAVAGSLARLLRTPAALGRWYAPLASAYVRGGDGSLAAAHYVLQSTQSGYRDLLQRDADGAPAPHAPDLPSDLAHHVE